MSRLWHKTRPVKLSHVSFYRQHPGSPSDLCLRRIGPDVLDPTHPASRTPYKAFPHTQTVYFTLRAFPNAILIPHPDSTGSPNWPQIDTWKDRIERAAQLRKELDLDPTARVQPSLVSEYTKWVAPPTLLPHPEASIPMSLYFSTSKARTHKHCVKRRRIRTKFREAVSKIVITGAYTTEAMSGVKALASNHEEAREMAGKWLLPDWAYICYPNPQLYLAPFHDFVPHIRTALQKIWQSGMVLEAGWAKAEMQRQTNVSPRPQNGLDPSRARGDKRLVNRANREPTRNTK